MLTIHLILLLIQTVYMSFNSSMIHDYSCYYNAANYWLKGLSLYSGCFVYLPQSAIFFTPLSILPPQLFLIIWKIILIIALYSSLFKILEFFKITTRKKLFMFFGITLLVAQGPLTQGQADILMISCMIFAIAAWYDEKYTKCAFLLCFSVFLDPLAIVFMGLMFLFHRQLQFKIICFSLFFILFPYIISNVNYVNQEYIELILRYRFLSSPQFPHVFNLFFLFTNSNISDYAQFIIRLIFSILTIVFSWQVKKKIDNRLFPFFLYMLSSLYMLLFNPHVESHHSLILIVVALPFIISQMKTIDTPLLTLIFIINLFLYIWQKIFLNSMLQPIPVLIVCAASFYLLKSIRHYEQI